MTDEQTWPDGSDDEPPWADPQIQKDYQAALGGFLVGFNSVENLIGDIIKLALSKAGRSDIVASMIGDLYARKVTSLELLSIHFPQIGDAKLFKELRAMGTERNKLAHGHFDQNPFDGSYNVVTAKGPQDFPVKKVLELAQEAERLLYALAGAQAMFWFDDAVDIDAEEQSK